MRTFFTLSLICLTVGCGGKPEFAHREEYEQLAPYAQKYTDELLDGYFGSPTDMVVWERLPLEIHLAEGQVTAASDRSVKLELTDPHSEIRPGTEITLNRGEETESVWVREWNEETHTATVDPRVSFSVGEETETADEAPEADGDTEDTEEAAVPQEVSAIVGPGQILADGRMLYAEHCQHCHGTAGDGNGPTAPYLNPRPRDYRQGLFKFTTTKQGARAQRSDLHRLIENGIPGTYMPSFKLLTDDEMKSITEYILWLSMRGEVEYGVVVNDFSRNYSNEVIVERTKGGGETYKEIEEEFKEVYIEEAEETGGLAEPVDFVISKIVNDWKTAQEEQAAIVPLTPRIEPTEESIAIGRRLYLAEALKCAQCHGEAGYGDGFQTYTVVKEGNPGVGLFDDWGNPIKPRNLHTGIYRGGRRPIDLYARIYAGIKGTPMPPFSTALIRRKDNSDAESALTDEDIWHLVNYIYSVPFETPVAGTGGRVPAPAVDAGEGAEDGAIPAPETEDQSAQNETEDEQDVAAVN